MITLHNGDCFGIVMKTIPKQFMGDMMKEYIEYEIDGYFIMDEVSMKDSGLPYDMFVTMNDEVNTTPYVFCRTNNKDLSDAIVVSIEENPCVMRGDFKNSEEQEQIFNFVRLNKELFLDYWNRNCFSDRFYDELKGVIYNENL